ncbi:helix-turn-helix domain-containing protein [Leptotrichia shahii]|uniref:helix-turn-helix domain-containing protein n=1 Tax=Leptotrichia shahii TaxID=157691 RepID=UPI0028D4C026|nr:helix-turn-helix domain-containing protein [Leptotrichia shahii]
MGRKEECHIRIKKAMNLRGLTQSDIVEKTNIKKSALSQYISGKITPRQNAIDELSKVLNVSEPWLMGYDVPMERNANTTQREPEIPEVDTSVLTPEELAEFNKVTQTNQLLFFNDIGDDDHDMAVFKNVVIDILLKQRKKKEEE